MPGQKLTPKIPNARVRTSVPTFIRELPPPPVADVDVMTDLYTCHIAFLNKVTLVNFILTDVSMRLFHYFIDLRQETNDFDYTLSNC